MPYLANEEFETALGPMSELGSALDRGPALGAGVIGHGAYTSAFNDQKPRADDKNPKYAGPPYLGRSWGPIGTGGA